MYLDLQLLFRACTASVYQYPDFEFLVGSGYFPLRNIGYRISSYSDPQVFWGSGHKSDEKDATVLCNRIFDFENPDTFSHKQVPTMVLGIWIDKYLEDPDTKRYEKIPQCTEVP